MNFTRLQDDICASCAKNDFANCSCSGDTATPAAIKNRDPFKSTPNLIKCVKNLIMAKADRSLTYRAIEQSEEPDRRPDHRCRSRKPSPPQPTPSTERKKPEKMTGNEEEQLQTEELMFLNTLRRMGICVQLEQEISDLAYDRREMVLISRLEEYGLWWEATQPCSKPNSDIRVETRLWKRVKTILCVRITSLIVDLVRFSFRPLCLPTNWYNS